MSASWPGPHVTPESKSAPESPAPPEPPLEHAHTSRPTSMEAVATRIFPRSFLAGGLQERLPLFELPAAPQEDLRRHRPLGSERPAGEAHVGFLGCLPALAEVADAARGHQI